MSGTDKIALLTDLLERSLEINFTLGTRMDVNKEDAYSPLDMAIINSDKATVYSLLDKIQAPPERLLLTCLFADKKMTDEEVKTRIEIFEKILSNNAGHSVPISLEQLHEHLRSLPDDKSGKLTMTLGMAFKNGMSLYALPRKLKLDLLRLSIFRDDDYALVVTLILLFCTRGGEWLRVCKTANGGDFENDYLFNSEDVLQLLDLTEARKVFLGLNYDRNGFQHIRREETVRILTTICPSFTSCHKLGNNYLHVAANAGNIRMIKHLMALNYDVNERDQWGNTPLMRIHPRIDATEVTRTLLSYRADVDAVNKLGYNVAHIMVYQLKKEKFKTIKMMFEWITLMRGNAHLDLFSMEDNEGATPVESLLRSFGEYHPFVYLLYEHVPRYKVLTLRHGVYNYNDHQFMELLLREFGRSGCPTSYKPEFKVVDHMLGYLDLTAAHEAFLQLDLRRPHEAFKHTVKSETLDLLKYICFHFEKCNRQKMSYSQLAVHHERWSWIWCHECCTASTDPADHVLCKYTRFE